MSNYKPTRELNPTSNNPLVVLTLKIENLVAPEEFTLAMSALVSATLRTEALKYEGSQREAAHSLARLFENIARTCEN
jgi:hypothetical protein